MQYLYQCGAGPEQNPCPDIILLDINMPKMNGLEALGLIRANDRFKSNPVVILSTSNDIHSIDLSYKLGANSFFMKPIGFDQLAKIMSVLGTYWFNLAHILSVNDSFYRDEAPINGNTTVPILIVADSTFIYVINIGIGGSDLGPRMAYGALRHPAARPGYLERPGN
jgi:DNA-binding LytR/AlgR family response regulator